jgi:CspA family cold shock protein
MKGTIKRLVKDKGFGFIAGDSGPEYFFHQSACTGRRSTSWEGQTSLEVGQGPKGPRAENDGPRPRAPCPARTFFICAQLFCLADLLTSDDTRRQRSRERVSCA